MLGDIPVTELTPNRVESFNATRLRDVSVHTVNLELRVLNTSVSQAKSLQYIPGLIPGAFRLIRAPASEPPAWLDHEQVAAVLEHPDQQFRRFMLFALHTGCRRNEVLGIRWSDIDLPKRQIVVRGQIGKMGKLRTIPISDVLAEVLIKWPADRVGPLFPDYKSDTVSQKFRRWVHKLGLPEGISLHSLRSTFACHLIERGVDIYTVSRLLGHSSVKVTEKHYLALDQGRVKVAVNKLSFGS